MTKLWIDDLCQPPEGWHWAKTSSEAITLIEKNYYETISFDHDLGGEDTSTRILSWMAGSLSEDSWPTKIMVHSANPTGAQNLMWLAKDYAPSTTMVQRVSVSGL